MNNTFIRIKWNVPCVIYGNVQQLRWTHCMGRVQSYLRADDKVVIFFVLWSFSSLRNLHCYTLVLACKTHQQAGNENSSPTPNVNKQVCYQRQSCTRRQHFYKGKHFVFRLWIILRIFSTLQELSVIPSNKQTTELSMCRDSVVGDNGVKSAQSTNIQKCPVCRRPARKSAKMRSGLILMAQGGVPWQA